MDRPLSISCYHEKVATFYQRLITDHSSDAIGRVGWTSQETQYRRFAALLRQADLKSSEDVLDIGCGTGDLVEFLRKVQLPRQYLGLDLMEENIMVARQRFHTDAHVHFMLGQPWSIKMPSDIVLGSGIFSLPSNNWETVVQLTLARLRLLARRVVVVNFLRRTTDSPCTTSTYRVTREELIEVLRGLNTPFALKEGNHPEATTDFTVRLAGEA